MTIPPDIDEIMWTIAEQDDPNAVHQFVHRYPKYADELYHRLKSIDALKASGKAIPAANVPIFRNLEVPKPNYTMPIVISSVALVVLSGVAYFAGRGNSESGSGNVNPAVVTNPMTNPVTNPAAGTQEPGVVFSPPTGQNSSSVSGNQLPYNQQAPLVQQPNVAPEVPKTPLKSLHLESAKLYAAIMLVAESGGFTVNIAPGLPNPEVKLDYDNMTAFQMLQELGKTYAFTPLMDGERQILILPVRDEPSQNDNRLN